MGCKFYKQFAKYILTSVHWINTSYLFGNTTNQILLYKMECNILIKAIGIKAK